MNRRRGRIELGLLSAVAVFAAVLLFVGIVFRVATPTASPRTAPRHVETVGDEPRPLTEKEFEELQDRLRRERCAACGLPEPIAAPPIEAAGPPPGALHFGYLPPTEDERRETLQELPKPTLEDAAPQLFQDRGPPAAGVSFAEERKPVILTRALQLAHLRKFGRPWVVVAQEIGDCVSHGYANAVTIMLATGYLAGTSGDFDIVSSEALYGLMRVEAVGKSRGGYSDGCYGGAASKAVRWGVVFRRDYSAEVGYPCDLRKYAGSRAKDWGNYGCGGRDDGGKLDAIAKRHAVQQVALVTSFKAAAVAIENGYPVPVCSGQGFTLTRDADGNCRPSGSWSHCMAFVGVRYEPRPSLLCQNSWGPNVPKGPKWPDDPLAHLPAPFRLKTIGGDGAQLDPIVRPTVFAQPFGAPGDSEQTDGSFWVDANVADRMLAGRDSYALSDVVGFPRRSMQFLDQL